LQNTGAVIARIIAAFLLAASGGVISASLKMSHERLCRLISFAAGSLLGVTLFSLLPEIFFKLSIIELLLGIGSGYLLFFLISRFVFHICPACAASHFDEATTHRFGEIAGAMVIALGLHSAVDGLALSVGGESHMAGSLGLSLLLAICVHKIPEGLALGSLLLASGLTKTRTLAWVAAVESTTLIGGIIGIWAVPRINELWLDLILAHIGGGFVFLAIHAVFGELAKHNPKRVLISFFSGIALIAVLNVLLRLF
jgi:zinc transporter ZupT